MFVADVVRLAHGGNEALVIVAQLRQHIVRIDIGRVVVGDTLVASNVTDRTQRGSADFPHPFGDHVGDSEDLFGLLVEQ